MLLMLMAKPDWVNLILAGWNGILFMTCYYPVFCRCRKILLTIILPFKVLLLESFVDD